MRESEAAGTRPRLRIGVGSESGGRRALDAARAAAGADVDVRGVGPVGIPDLEPLATVTRDGRAALFPAVTPERAEALATALSDGLPTEGALAVADAADGLPRPDEGPLAVGVRRVLADAGWTAPTDLAAVESGISNDPDAVAEAVRGAGVRGRGRGDAATNELVTEQWDLAEDAPGDPVVVVNANEADEHATADRLLVETVTAAIADAALAVAEVVGATDVVLYCNEADEVAVDRAETVAAETDTAETDTAETEIRVAVGPDSYLAGEETMALESLEGNDRLEARRRPPGPAEWGLFGRPTVVHTPRTLAQIRALVREGECGAPSDPGTRLVTVTGDDQTRTVELPTDAPLREAVADEFKMALVGGRFGGLTRSLDVDANADALEGAQLGANGVVELFDDSRCAVAAVGRRAKVAREENCGRCVPCREGSVQLHELLREVYDGRYADDELGELARTMRGVSLCSFGRDAARPVLTAMESFDDEFRAHADGRCPAGECDTA